MMTKFMNKQRGLLAAIMALVMVFASAAFVAAEVDAAGTATVDEGPLDFEDVSNNLGNDLDVTYVSNENGGTYYVKGVLKYQGYESDGVFETLWPSNNTKPYGIAFDVTGPKDTAITVGTGNGKIGDSGEESCLLYLDDEVTSKEVTVGSGDSKKTYTLDFGGVVYLDEDVIANAVFTVEEFNAATKSGTIYIMNNITVGAFTLGGNLTINTDNGKLTVKADGTNGGMTDKGDLIAINVGGHDLTVNGKKGFAVEVTGKGTRTIGETSYTYDRYINTFGIAGNGTSTITLNAPTTITVNVTGKVANNNGACGIFGKTIIIGESGSNVANVVTISAGNRAFNVSDLTVYAGMELKASAFEKAINVTNLLVVYGTVDASLLSTQEGVNNAGTDERHGIRTKTINIYETGVVNTESIRLTNGEAGTISGTLNVFDSDVAGRNGTKDEPVVIPAGLIVANKDGDNKALNTLGILKLAGKGTINLEAGCEILGIIKVDVDGSVSAGDVTFGTKGAIGETTITQAIPIIAGSDMTISVGSVVINGIATSPDANGVIEISGNVTLSGTIDKGVTVKSTASSTITVTADGLVVNGTLDLTLGTNEIKAVGDVSGNGNITAGTDNLEVSKSPTSSFNIALPNGMKADVADNGKVVTDFATLVEAIDSKEYNVIVLDGGIEYSGGVKELTIPAYVTLYLNGKTIEVKSGESLEVNGAHIYAGNPTGTAVDDRERIILKANANLYLDGADVRAIVDADENAYISITNAKKMTVKGDSTADLGVGYGNTLVLSDLRVDGGKSIEAYGTVVIEETVTVTKGSQFNVYAGGNAQIDGALVIEGIANIDGAADVNGSVKVYTKDGGASFNVGEKGEVDVAGTMDVLKGTTKNTTNTLNVEGDLNIEGTLTITGTLKGNVNDMGTIIFNGAATGDNTGFTVYDGVTLTIASVNGTLKITDNGIEDDDYYEYDEDENLVEKAGYFISTGNSVVITNVKNVTVSVVLDESTVKVNDVSKRLVKSEMTVTGNISAYDDNITIGTTTYSGKFTLEAACPSVAYKGAETVKGIVSVGDITLGKNVLMDIRSDNVVVTGTVTVSAEDSNLTIAEEMVIDIIGTIVNATSTNKSAETIEIDGRYNGAKYTIVDADLNETFYYTTFENAIAAVADAKDNEITVSGEIEIASEMEIPAGAEVIMDKGDKLVIDVDGKLTVAATALLEASSAVIEVDGMLVIVDKESGLEAPTKANFVYQVYTVSGETETYSGLVLALKNAVDGDIITVVGEGKIEKSVTIPEGVTLEVPKTSSLVIGADDEKVVLTVAGTLKLEGPVSASTGNDGVEIKVPGVVTGADKIMKMDSSSNVLITIEDYVSFKMKVDGKENIVYSNLAYAAENASYGAVDIVGDVSGGDVTFTQAEKGDAIAISIPGASTLAAGTLTLVGDGASITATGEVTGTIAAAAGSVDLNKVSGITLTVVIDEDVDGTTDMFKVYSATKLVGKMDVTTGTVTVDGLTVGYSEKDVLTIDADATLVVPSGETLTVSAMMPSTGVTQYYGLIVDGTLAIDAGTITADATSQILVNGTMTVADNQNATIAGKLTVLGTLDIISTDEEKAKLTVNGIIVLGTAPALGANGVISGPISVANSNAAYIVAYAGADVSAALLNVNDSTGESDIDSTEIVINGVPYMTVYVYDEDNISLKDLEDANYFKTDGFENDVAWASPAEDTTKVGVFDKVEGTMLAAKTKLTVSAGVGLKVYIDGLAIENFYGKYDVNGTATPDDDDVTGYWIQFGTHTVSFAVESGYDGSNATITVNGVQVSNNGTFTVDVDDKDVVVIASGAVPAQSGSTVVVDEDDGMALTDILLIVLVVLIVIMAIIVALRMMRS